MERSGCRRALLRGKGFRTHRHVKASLMVGKRSAESLGGIAFWLRYRLLGFTMEAAR